MSVIKIGIIIFQDKYIISLGIKEDKYTKIINNALRKIKIMIILNQMLFVIWFRAHAEIRVWIITRIIRVKGWEKNINKEIMVILIKKFIVIPWRA